MNCCSLSWNPHSSINVLVDSESKIKFYNGLWYKKRLFDNQIPKYLPSVVCRLLFSLLYRYWYKIYRRTTTLFVYLYRYFRVIHIASIRMQGRSWVLIVCTPWGSGGLYPQNYFSTRRQMVRSGVIINDNNYQY